MSLSSLGSETRGLYNRIAFWILNERTLSHPSPFSLSGLEGPSPTFEGFQLPIDTVNVTRTISSAFSSLFNVGTRERAPSAKASLLSCGLCWIYERSARSCYELRSARCSFVSPFRCIAYIRFISSLHFVCTVSVCLTSSPRSNVNLLFILWIATFIPTAWLIGVVSGEMTLWFKKLTRFRSPNSKFVAEFGRLPSWYHT